MQWRMIVKVFCFCFEQLRRKMFSPAVHLCVVQQMNRSLSGLKSKNSSQLPLVSRFV